MFRLRYEFGYEFLQVFRQKSDFKFLKFGFKFDVYSKKVVFVYSFYLSLLYILFLVNVMLVKWQNWKGV